ncbi:hypothetical protein DICVIV_12550 [Dictyocaulus viviparus]|uniref:Reverse transcriptase domain-containing protein n=1 Tax=Dictyocaulus viviparus TaxID=29172 RepID=A0A0D8XGG2_DICVI|nr:hypothetical protein DICVIV_12550 [Dictyocaulus viviparus]
MDHIHAITGLIKASREYRKPHCLTFKNLKKSFESVETEAVIEALTNQRLPTPCIKILGVRQDDATSAELSTTTLEAITRKSEWDDM